MIENGGMMKCGDQSKDVKFSMCDYHFKIHMFVTKWVVVMLLEGKKWLQTLGPITMDLKYL